MTRLALLVPAVLFAAAAAADDPPADGPPPTEAQVKAVQAVEDLATAARMVELGRRTKCPEALVAAALTIHRTPAAEAAVEKGVETAPAGNEVAELLAEAATLRPQDPTLREAVEAARTETAEKARGATHGARTYPSLRITHGQRVTIAVVPFTGSCVACLRVSKTDPEFRPRGLSLIPPAFATLEVLDDQNRVVARNTQATIGAPGVVRWEARAGVKTNYSFRATNTCPPGVGQPNGVTIVCNLIHN